MADVLTNQSSYPNMTAPVVERFEDMGDGTHARVVSTRTGGGSVATKLPTASSSTIVALTTSGTAGTYTAFASLASTHVDVINNTGVRLRVRKTGVTEYMPVPDGQGYMVFPVTNANQVEISLDVTGTAVTARATAYAV